MRSTNRTGWLVVLALVLPVVAACASAAAGPPEIVVDRTACSHCGMLISEPLYAAASQAAGAEARAFDDIGCLVDAARKENAAVSFWFHDVSDGGWIDGSTATFVKSPGIRTPMGGGIIAFRDRAAAARAASAQGGVVVTSIPDLIGRKGDGQ